MDLDMDLPDVQRDYLQTALDSAESLMQIINEILDFSKIEAGKLGLEKFPFSLREFLGDTMKSMAVRVVADDLELAWQVDSEVPDWIIGDATRMRQIIVNLVGNSIKFTEQGEIVVRVTAKSVQKDRAEFEFSVRDTGIGIPPDRLDAVFQAFQQADSSTTRRFGGTGLGLAICSRLVNLMKGQIWVESQVDHGTTFKFTCELGIAPESESKFESEISLRGLHVLVVDDNETNRKILNQMLSKWELDVTLAADGKTAMETAIQRNHEGRPFDLVITDLHMPGMDGFEVASRLREIKACEETRIIMLTSGASENDSEKCGELNISRCLLKPAKQSELLHAIYFALNIKRKEPMESLDPSSSASDTFDAQNILLAEDGLANQKLAVALLQRWGHQVTVAENGAEAVEAVEQGDFDLVLMDVQMPEMDGLEATREIRKREQGTEKHIPIIAMTAHAMTGDRQKCLDAGMDGYLSKPVRRDKLYQAIAELDSASRTSNPQNRPPDSNGSSSENDQSLIDWNDALLVVDGETEILKEIADAAVGEVGVLIQRLGEAISEQDAELVGRSAHSIHGTLRVFRNEEAIELVNELQLRSRENSLDGVTEPFEKLVQLMSQISAELVEFQNRN